MSETNFFVRPKKTTDGIPFAHLIPNNGVYLGNGSVLLMTIPVQDIRYRNPVKLAEQRRAKRAHRVTYLKIVSGVISSHIPSTEIIN